MPAKNDMAENARTANFATLIYFAWIYIRETRLSTVLRGEMRIIGIDKCQNGKLDVSRL